MPRPQNHLGPGPDPPSLPPLFFFLLRCNSHNIKSTILKSAARWHLVHSQCCAAATSVRCRPFPHPQEKPGPHQQAPPAPSPAPAPGNHEPPSVTADVPVLDVNGIARRVALCVWRLSPSTTFSGPHTTLWRVPAPPRFARLSAPPPCGRHDVTCAPRHRPWALGGSRPLATGNTPL